MLNQNVQRSGLTREAYLRVLISGFVPKEKPPLDFWAMNRELHYIGNNLNQIALKAHALGAIQAHAVNAIDAKHYDEGVQLFQDAVLKIMSAVLDPVPMENETKVD